MDTPLIIVLCTLGGFTLAILTFIWVVWKDSNLFRKEVFRIENEVKDIRKETLEIRREFHIEMKSFHDEMKSFHGRLCTLEERYLQIITKKK